MGRPFVSVVICHHQGRALLARCLKSVEASHGVHVDPIVVTSDATYANREVRLYFLEDGPAGKRNFGVEKARSDLLVFLDDDVEIAPTCLMAFWEWFQAHPKCGMAFAKVYKMEAGRRDEFDATGSWLTWTGFLYDRAGNGQRDSGQYRGAEKILSSKSATCALQRESFLQAGGFDVDYQILGEETDLSWRLWLRGWECWYVPTAVSWHAFGCESLKPKAQYYTSSRIFTNGPRNYIWLLFTNLGLLRLILILPFHTVLWLVAATGMFLTGRCSYGLLILNGLYQAFSPLPWKKRFHVQSSRTISDRKLFSTIYTYPPLAYFLGRLSSYITQGLHG